LTKKVFFSFEFVVDIFQSTIADEKKLYAEHCQTHKRIAQLIVEKQTRVFKLYENGRKLLPGGVMPAMEERFIEQREFGTALPSTGRVSAKQQAALQEEAVLHETRQWLGDAMPSMRARTSNPRSAWRAYCSWRAAQHQYDAVHHAQHSRATRALVSATRLARSDAAQRKFWSKFEANHSPSSQREHIATRPRFPCDTSSFSLPPIPTVVESRSEPGSCCP